MALFTSGETDIFMEKVVVFDLDHTLFNTSSFKKKLFSSLKTYGISSEEVEAAYKKIMNQGGKFKYDYRVEDHVRELRKKHVFSVKKAEHTMFSVLTQAEKFLYPKVKNILAELRRRGFHLILISRGNKFFNHQKISQSGLDKFFHKVHVTNKSKLGLHRNYFKKAKQGWAVNDNVNELLLIKRQNPHVKYVLKRGSDYSITTSGELIAIDEISQLRRLIT